MRRFALIAAGVLVVMPVAGCGAKDDQPGAAPSSSAAATSALVAGPVEAKGFISDIEEAIQRYQSVHLEISASLMASGNIDVSYGTGAPRIRVDGDLTGQGHTVLVIADGVVYVEQGDGGKYRVIDKDDPTYGELLRTFTHISPVESIAGLAKGIDSVTSAGTTTIDGVSMHRYKVSANPSRATGAYRALAGTSNIADSLMFEFYVDDDNLLHQVETKVNGQPVTVFLTDWGKPVTIDVPSSDNLVTY